MRIPTACVALLFGVGSASLPTAHAGGPLSFTSPQELAINSTPAVATAGDGNWLVVGAGSSGDDAGVTASHSADGGRSWSSPLLVYALVPGTFTVPQLARVATDGSGTWGVVYCLGMNITSLVNCSGLHDSDIGFASSADNGATWTPNVLLNSNAATEPIGIEDRMPDIAAAAGTWITAWDSDSSLGGALGIDFDDSDILYARSTDGGTTWTDAAPLNTNAAVDSDHDTAPALATDGAGTWIAVWTSVVQSDGDRIALAAVSSDDGLSWSAPTEVSDSSTNASLVVYSVDIATDSTGSWVVAWASNASIGASGRDIVTARSSNDGSTWQSPVTVKLDPPDDNYIDTEPAIAAQDANTFAVVWSTFDPLKALGKKDTDIVMSISGDAGASWRPAESVDSTAADDGVNDEDEGPAVAADASGTVVAVWTSIAITNPNGIFSPEERTLTLARSHVDCPTVPAVDCIQTTKDGASRLKIRNAEVGRDSMFWRWGSGQETLLTDLGDPLTTSEYTVCLYETVATISDMTFEEDIEAAGECGAGRPCWKARADGFRYIDKPLVRGGTRKLDVRPGPVGKAKFSWKGRGPQLGPPSLPFDAAAKVTMQLHNLETSTCWQAEFSSPKRNEADRYDARSD